VAWHSSIWRFFVRFKTRQDKVIRFSRQSLRLPGVGWILALHDLGVGVTICAFGAGFCPGWSEGSPYAHGRIDANISIIPSAVVFRVTRPGAFTRYYVDSSHTSDDTSHGRGPATLAPLERRI